jgi:hypothetical protein
LVVRLAVQLRVVMLFSVSKLQITPVVVQHGKPIVCSLLAQGVSAGYICQHGSDVDDFGTHQVVVMSRDTSALESVLFSQRQQSVPHIHTPAPLI